MEGSDSAWSLQGSTWWILLSAPYYSVDTDGFCDRTGPLESSVEGITAAAEQEDRMGGERCAKCPGCHTFERTQRTHGHITARQKARRKQKHVGAALNKRPYDITAADRGEDTAGW
ncbi:hypothetical protein DPEC_G00101400 [Dallia pectoralis]|uniref:Uncharacterized protein n=1 Tax=Dallia pectoralis TaxID=75939 RepID=A0ACC2GWG2_DALPE|nr:hypothetical protein DPEC_G00101400 [Dallia pectoralis]